MPEDNNSQIQLDKQQIAEVMMDIDICMMTTSDRNGSLHSRPMSNNRQVEWDGDNWFFARKDSSQVKDLLHDSSINLAFAKPNDIVFLSLVGEGELIDDVAKKEELWQDELEMWFPEGPKDDALTLIKVRASEARFWSKEGEGTLTL